VCGHVTSPPVISAFVVEGRRQADVAVAYGVSKGWVSKLLARYREERPRSSSTRGVRRPAPASTAEATVTLILELREKLTTAGLDAGSDTIAWHLQTASPDPGLAGHDQPLPDQSWAGGPRAEEATQVLYIRFQAAMPNQTWGSPTSPTTGSPHRSAAPGKDVEIISWLNDCTRYTSA